MRSSSRGRSFALSTGSNDEIKTSAENLIESFSAIRSGDIDLIQSTLIRENSATVSDIDQHGKTMLHIACSSTSKQELDVVRFLLEQGSGVNVQDKRGNTALHNAARISGHEVVKLLLTFGCDAMLKNSDGQTPLGLASAKARGKVTQILRQQVHELTAVPKIPTCPRLIRSTSTSIFVSFIPPESVGGAEYPISTYDLRFSLRGLFTPWTIREGLTECEPTEINGLKPGTDYVMSIRANNRNGNGTWSNKSITMTTRSESYQENDKEDVVLYNGSNGTPSNPITRSSPSNSYSTSSSSYSTKTTTPTTPPMMRSESIETISIQRDLAEERALSLQKHRTNAERAMLRIEKDREAVSEQLKVMKIATRELRATLRQRETELNQMKNMENQRLLKEQQQRITSKISTTALETHSDLLRSVSKEEEYRLISENKELQSCIDQLKSDVRRNERKCREVQEEGAIHQKECVLLKNARKIFETNEENSKRHAKELEIQVQQERVLRNEAEERVAEMSSMVGRLQRQRDAAEAVAEQLEQVVEGKGVANNSKTALETIAQLQDALNTCNIRVFELAGIESQCIDLTSETDYLNTSMTDLENTKLALETELMHIKQERNELREQRDSSEHLLEEMRIERSRLNVIVKEMKEKEKKKEMDNETKGNGETGEGSREIVEETLRETKKLANEREELLRQVLERAAEEVLKMMSSHKEWIAKTEKVEKEFAKRSGVEIGDEDIIPVLPPRIVTKIV